MQKPAASSESQSTLGIIAGGGVLPRMIAEGCRAKDRPFFILAFEESTETAAVEGMPHAWVRLGAIGKAISELRGAGVRDVVMAGKMKRPSLSNLRPDLKATMLLAKLGPLLLSGDDGLLKALVTFLENEGFRVVGADSVLTHLLAEEGVMGRHKPDEQALKDIALGLAVLRALGPFDIGQAVIVQQNAVLGIEAAEGTDALIARCAGVKRERAGGVLVKARKPGQDARVDLPAVGPDTVAAMHRAGFSGIAIEAGGALVVNREAVVQDADRLQLFVTGVKN
jgi:DUF1009 family protein